MDTNDRFADALEKYGDTIYRLALVRLQSREDAEDILQETFCRLLNAGGWSKWTDERLKAWLLRVAVNCCNDLGRKKGRECFLSEDELRTLAGIAPPEELGIWEIVNALEEPDRSLIHLFYGEEIPLKECAKLLGLTYSNTRVRIHRARKKIREELNEGDS